VYAREAVEQLSSGTKSETPAGDQVSLINIVS